MITTNKLRIGNYVTDQGKILMVVALFENGGVSTRYLSGASYGHRKCSGIELTEKWLLDLGFDKIDKQFFKDRFIVEQGIGYFFNKGYSFRLRMDYTDSIHARDIRYVHQLQNITYAITGEELQYNNKDNQ